MSLAFKITCYLEKGEMAASQSRAVCEALRRCSKSARGDSPTQPRGRCRAAVRQSTSELNKVLISEFDEQVTILSMCEFTHLETQEEVTPIYT